jgi:hypothetical protein
MGVRDLKVIGSDNSGILQAKYNLYESRRTCKPCFINSIYLPVVVTARGVAGKIIRGLKSKKSDVRNGLNFVGASSKTDRQLMGVDAHWNSNTIPVFSVSKSEW